MDNSEVGSVLVAVRIRPRILTSNNPTQTAERLVVTAAVKVGDDAVRVTETRPATPGSPSSHTSSSGGTEVKSQTFNFDAVFDEDSTQEDLYNETTIGAVDAALQCGLNATVITYGQTGSGKTFTVLGAVSQNPLVGDQVIERDTGLFLRVLQDVFKYKRQCAARLHVVVAISVMEIYLDSVRDLLGKDPSAALKMAVNADSVDMPDLTVQPLEHLRDAVNCYKKATGRRVSRATDANDQSSRSHALFAIEIFQQERTVDNPAPLPLAELAAARDKARSKAGSGQLFSCGRASYPPLRHSRIVLTDLAGSEKMKVSNARGDALEEMKKINGSLTCLGNVVHSLYSGSKHVPYRDSKLTIILRSTFASPKAHIVLIANVAPTVLTIDETLSTLFFANKVKAMRSNGAAGNAAETLLESELLHALRTSEELCGEHRLVAETHGSCSLGALYAAYGRLRGLGVSRTVREAAVARAITQRTALLSRSREETLQHEAIRGDTIVDSQRSNRVTDYVDRRQSYERKIEVAAHELTEASRIASEWAAEQARTLRDANATLHSIEAELEQLNRRHATAALSAKQLTEEQEKLDALLAKAEQEFRRKHATEFALFDKEDALQRTLDERHSAQCVLVDRGLKCRGVLLDLVETATQNAIAVVQAYDAERDFKRIGIYEWLRPVVVNVASNAVLLSIRAHFVAPRRLPSHGVRVAAAAPPKLPKTLPSGSALHVDPGSPSSSRTAPKAPLRDDAGPLPAAPLGPPPPPPLEVAPETVFDSPTLVTEVINYIGSGAVMLKHGRSGRPHHRFVFGAATPPSPDLALSDPRNVSLYYCEERSMRAWPMSLPFIMVSSIHAVTLGQSTAVFKRSKRRDDYYLSFSVHYVSEQQNRTLDLVTETDYELEAWVMGICALARVNPCFGEPKVDLERLPPPQSLTDVEEALCREWHIRPALLVSIREKLEDLRRRRDAPNVRLTPGGMRHVSKIDIFRSNMLWRYFVSVGYIAPSTKALQYVEYDSP